VTAAALLAAVASGVSAAPAGAIEQLQIRGAGFGHGVGMSQYGARGMALRGADAKTILAHYYTGTELSRLPRARRVRVALQWGRRETTVSGAGSIGGLRVSPEHSYRLIRSGGGIEVRRVGASRALGRAGTGVRVLPGGGGAVRVAGQAADGVQDGAFRGRLDVLPDGDGIVVVNDLDLEDYLRGVVTKESPASWPAAALQAQAIAARTYAITSAVGGRVFDQWPDTRSQVYAGISGESAAGDAAIAATRGRVVTVDRKPVTTYFFSTSGGRTEDARNVFPDPAKRSWLVSVPDPHEPDAGLRRWTRTFSTPGANDRTARFGVGALRRIEVLRRGDSPRVVRARVVGTRGVRRVSGEALQLAFDLPDRWASFATVSISRCLPVGRDDGRGAAGDEAPEAGGAAASGTAPAAGADAGGAGAAAAGTGAPGAGVGGAAGASAAEDPATGALAIAERGTRDLAALLSQAGERAPEKAANDCRLVGGIRPAPEGGAARVQRRVDGRWRTVRRVALDGGGGFEVAVPSAGRWRVAADGFTTPSVAAG
jgi:stage II sporulation protein D